MNDYLKYGITQKPSRWLWDSPTSRSQYYTQSFLYGSSSFARGVYSARDNISYMDDYLKSRGMSYADVKYASRTPGWSGGASAGSGLMSASKNITSLYSSSLRSKRRDDDRLKRAFNDGRMWEQSYRWHKYKP